MIFFFLLTYVRKKLPSFRKIATARTTTALHDCAWDAQAQGRQMLQVEKNNDFSFDMQLAKTSTPKKRNEKK